ncbi:metallophosphoesterase family protein [Numidum massiliense]|uniref:metallophosphoesterase family protein n=1 Tax=Numidum massiliense TaxID=1522315 RepID=UPI00164EA4E7|nr:metallophosphoesterase [Numidum massiliense]
MFIVIFAVVCLACGFGWAMPVVKTAAMRAPAGETVATIGVTAGESAVAMRTTTGEIAHVAADKPRLSFAVMSDIHIYEDNEDVHRRFTAALQDYWQLNREIGLLAVNGDLTNGFPEHFTILRRLIEGTPHAPLHFTLGNHDFYRMRYNDRKEKDLRHFPNSWSNEKALQLFQRFTGYERPYHDVWLNGYHFIFMSHEKYVNSRLTHGRNGFISDAQLMWLRQKLQERQPQEQTREQKLLGTRGAGGSKRPTFVFFHHPLPNTLPGSEGEAMIWQHKELRNILEEHPEVVFFSGHTHAGLKKTKQMHANRFLMLGSSSIMRHGESVYVEVYDDYLDIHSRNHLQKEWIPERSFRYDLKHLSDNS